MTKDKMEIRGMAKEQKTIRGMIILEAGNKLLKLKRELETGEKNMIYLTQEDRDAFTDAKEHVDFALQRLALRALTI